MPAGRPKKQFNPEQMRQIEQMAFDNCHTRTIAEAIGESQDTIKRHFASLLKKKRAEGRAALRRSQRKLAATNPAMAIFLGKNELGQADKQEVGGDITHKVEFVDVEPMQEKQTKKNNDDNTDITE